jgi:hypothetical protein
MQNTIQAIPNATGLADLTVSIMTVQEMKPVDSAVGNIN